MTASVHIGTLRFKGSEPQRQGFINQLEQSSWSTLDEREYVFIRSVSVAGSDDHLADQFVAGTVEARLRAINGWQAGSEQEQAVFFSSQSELLACLSLALLYRRPTWYWAQWRGLFEQTFAQALAELWSQNSRELPAVTAHLDQQSQLGTFWREIPESAAQRLCQLLMPDHSENHFANQDEGVEYKQAVPANWLSRWQGVFTADRHDSARIRLAALIIMQEWQPLALLAPYDRSRFHALIRALQLMLSGSESLPGSRQTIASTGGASERNRPPAQTDHDRTVHNDVPDPVSERKSNKENRITTARAEYSTPQQPSVGGATATTEFPDHEPQRRQTDIKTDANEAEGTQRPPSGMDPELAENISGPLHQLQQDRQDLIKRYRVEQGGLFYLLNFLNLAVIQEYLLASTVQDSFMTGWGWLYRLGSALGIEDEPALQGLFVDLCGFENKNELASLPVLSGTDHLLALGRQRYSERVFSETLLPVPAEVVLESCHVDIYYALKDVSLEVRRVGLDLDPGWLPWLGKVVTFHYHADS